MIIRLHACQFHSGVSGGRGFELSRRDCQKQTSCNDDVSNLSSQCFWGSNHLAWIVTTDELAAESLTL